VESQTMCHSPPFALGWGLGQSQNQDRGQGEGSILPSGYTYPPNVCRGENTTGGNMHELRRAVTPSCSLAGHEVDRLGVIRETGAISASSTLRIRLTVVRFE
jgi:hypothetical protein